MVDLHKYLAEELVPVNTALDNLKAMLPLAVQPVAGHILGAGGKRLRPFLTIVCAKLLRYKNENIYPLASCMEMLHVATLLHDDVLDSANLRRGKIATHLEFGIQRAILTGDAMLALGNAHVATYENPKLSICYSEATIRTATGEIMEIDRLRHCKQTTEEYLDIITNKTAWLIKASCEMGAIQANATHAEREALTAYGLNLGIAFQMVDDALDFAPEAITGKPTAGDILEGKLTLPLYLYRQNLNTNAQAAFDGAFATGMLTKTDVEQIAEEIRQQGLDEKTRQIAGDHLQKATNALNDLPNCFEKEILKQMITYVQNRKK